MDRIQPDPDQPRTEFDPEALDRLARELEGARPAPADPGPLGRVRGPLRGRVGERRWRAAQLAGLETLACVVVRGGRPARGPVDGERLREDLKPIEQAKAFRDLMDRNGWSTRRLADELSIHQPQVVQALGVLDLPPAVQIEIDGGNIPAATAREIHKLGTPAEQEAMARRVIAEGLRGADVRRVTKGKGKAKASKSRVFRLPLGRLTIDLRKAGASRRCWLWSRRSLGSWSMRSRRGREIWIVCTNGPYWRPHRAGPHRLAETRIARPYGTLSERPGTTGGGPSGPGGPTFGRCKIRGSRTGPHLAARAASEDLLTQAVARQVRQGKAVKPQRPGNQVFKLGRGQGGCDCTQGASGRGYRRGVGGRTRAGAGRSKYHGLKIVGNVVVGPGTARGPGLTRPGKAGRPD